MQLLQTSNDSAFGLNMNPKFPNQWDQGDRMGLNLGPAWVSTWAWVSQVGPWPLRLTSLHCNLAIQTQKQNA